MSPTSDCPLCADRLFTPVSTSDRDGRPLFNVLCRGCGLVFVHPQPSREALQDWYETSYRVEYKGIAQPRMHHVLRAGRVAIDRLARIRPLLVGRPRVLDVGAGGGEMLYMLVHLAGARADGLEPNIGYAQHARERLGLDVHVGFVEHAAHIVAGYDLITIHHVLEHLADPCAVMGALHGWLRPGGHLVVEVPNVEARCQAPAHTFHRAHLTSWGLPTLERLGLQAGLTPVSSRVSADGGNIEVLFVRDDVRQHTARTIAARTDGYAAHVQAVLAGHTTMRHYLSTRALRRFGSRLVRQAEERITSRSLSEARVALDALVREAQASVVFRGLAAEPA